MVVGARVELAQTVKNVVLAHVRVFQIVLEGFVEAMDVVSIHAVDVPPHKHVLMDNVSDKPFLIVPAEFVEVMGLEEFAESVLLDRSAEMDSVFVLMIAVTEIVGMEFNPLGQAFLSVLQNLVDLARLGILVEVLVYAPHFKVAM